MIFTQIILFVTQFRIAWCSANRVILMEKFYKWVQLTLLQAVKLAEPCQPEFVWQLLLKPIMKLMAIGSSLHPALEGDIESYEVGADAK